MSTETFCHFGYPLQVSNHRRQQFNCWFSFAPVLSGVVRHPRDLQVSVATRSCRVLIFAFVIVFICDLFVSRDDPLMS